MQKVIFLLALLLPCPFATARTLSVTSNSTIVVTAPDDWRAFPTIKPGPSIPAGSYRVVPPAPRNVVCVVSILDQNKTEFTNATYLRRYLMADSAQYVNSPSEISKIKFKPLNIKDGLGFYANFVDPDLVGKPVQPRQYKTTTPALLNLGTNYLVKVTILCDDLDGRDHYEALKILESIRIKK